jgi:serine/threonine protein kinase
MINERADYKLLDYARELLTRVTTLTAKRAAQRAMLNIIVQTLGTLHMLAYECGVNFTHHDIHRDNLMLTERSRVAGGKRLTLWYRMQHKGETLYAESAPIAVDGAGSSAKVEFLVPIVKLIDFGMASYDYYDKLGRRFTSGTATRDYGANARFVNNAQEMREHSPLHDIIRLGLALFDIAAQLHFDAREQTPEQTAFIADIATHACYMIPFVSVTTKSARFKDANAETLYGRLATAALAHSWPECFELFRDARNADVLRVACVELITPRAKEHFSTVSLFELFTNVLRYAKDTPTTVAGTRVVEASELHIVQFSQAANVTVA